MSKELKNEHYASDEMEKDSLLKEIEQEVATLNSQQLLHIILMLSEIPELNADGE